MTNILVIKLGALGDFIYALGPMAAIRRFHAADRLILLTTPPFLSLGRECGYFDEVWALPRPSVFDISGWLSLRRRLNAASFSRVYDLQNNDRTAFYLRLFSPKPEWVGAAPGASHRNTDPARVSGHAFSGHVQTLSLAGITDVSLDSLAWMRSDLSVFSLPEPYVLLVPGSSPHRPEKRWPVEYYREFAAKLLRQGYRPVLVGSAAESEMCGGIARGLDIVNLAGKTDLRDLPSLARGAVAAAGNDTGPLHMMAVTGCPTLMFFCSKSSTVKKHGPQGPRALALESPALEEITVRAAWSAFLDLIPFRRGEENALHEHAS